MAESFLKKLRRLNVKRCEAVFHSLGDWNSLEWAGAICGEAGELANKCKKIRRGEILPENAIEEEMADVIIYLDLLGAYYHIDLEQIVIDKFNQVSKENDCEIKL